MLKSLEIQGFRCFRELRVDPLKRVNLFVGLNNAGKTSILDAAELVAIGRVEGLVRSAVRRGERVLGQSDLSEEFKQHTIDPSHLFFNHDLRAGKHFKITGSDDRKQWVKCNVEHASDQETLLRTLYFQSNITTKKGEHERLTISPSGGVLPPPRRLSKLPRVNFLAADSADSIPLGQLWDDLLLTPEEEEVTKSLRVIVPNLERLAFLSETRGTSSDILVKVKEFEQRLPLGTLGGGLRHLLGLVLNLLSARGGCLLVDEIDTGLHYSVLVDMWRLLIENAKRLDTQVFATTHSLDCVRALARLTKRYPDNAAEVMVHRVERKAPRTVVYDADEIVIAAESHIEVR